MDRTRLPARIAYTLVATPLACLAGFYVGAFLFGRALPFLEGIREPEPGWAEFVFSLLVGAGAGFTAFCYALTLPRFRLRRRRGRPWRMAASAAFVLVVSVTVASEGVPLRYTAGLMLWISLVLTFTFIRYGVLDAPARRSPAPSVPVPEGLG